MSVNRAKKSRPPERAGFFLTAGSSVRGNQTRGLGVLPAVVAAARGRDDAIGEHPRGQSRPHRRIGAGQGLAIYPGLSRSGTTISLALFTGIKRRWAAQFSFFIAFPAICGAALLKGKDLVETPGFALADLLRGPYLVGAITAAIVGYVALRLLLKLVQKARLHYLAIYCWLLAVVTLITLR